MKKLTIYDVKPGMKIFHNYKERIIQEVNVNDNCVVCSFRGVEYDIPLDEIFVSSISIKVISKLVFEAWKFLKESFDSSLLNSEIKRQFVVHWRNMCESDGNMDLYKIAFDDFVEFQKELLKVVEKAKALRVLNVPLLKEL